MHIESTTKVANSIEALDKLLGRISGGQQAKPDWIRLQGGCRLDRVEPEQRRLLLERLHGCVLRGFRANNVDIEDASARLDYWCSVASTGFHDFSEQGWMKCYDSPAYGPQPQSAPTSPLLDIMSLTGRKKGLRISYPPIASSERVMFESREAPHATA